MAVRVFQFSVVFAIGFCFSPAAATAVATAVTEIPLSLRLKDPKDVTVGRGQSASLKCEAISSPPGSNLSWSWQYEGNTIPSNDTRRQILSDGSLYISKVIGKKMEGQYQCIVRNNIGAILSNPATLTIASIGRDFMNQPENTTIYEYQPVLLPCHIQSIPDADVYWERDNKPLPHSTRYVPLPMGALLITSTHSSDAGYYRCIATNKLLNKKTKHSKTGQLTVLPHPQSTEPPKFLPLGFEPNPTVLAGNNLTLYCAVSGWPIPNIQWLYNMSIIVGNSSVLEIKNVSSYATGNYSCSVYNIVGHAIQHYNVDVKEPPYFNVTPVSISYPSASTVRLDCQAKGNPQPRLFWLKDGMLLQTVGRIKLQHSGLVLSHSFTTDSGVYQCVAVNSVGRTWVAAQLTPYFSQSRPSPPQNVRCRPYDSNSICLMWDPPKNITIQAYSIYAFTAVPKPGVGSQDFVTNYTYQLASGLDFSTNYTLYVRSYSKEASDQSNNVTCQTGIKGSRNLEVEYLSETSVKLKWSEMSTDIPCGSITALYKIQWKRTDQSSINVEHILGFKKVLSGLRPLATYEFRVESTTNKDEETPWTSFSLAREKSSSEATITSVIDYSELSNGVNETLVVPSSPLQVEADPLSPYSVNLTWINNAQGEDEISFNICYVEVNEENTCENGSELESETNHLEVQNLMANTLYEFKVRSRDVKGTYSQFSHSVQVQTFVDIPSAVRDLIFRLINSSTVCIRWRPPLHKNGKLVKYVALYTSEKNQPLEQWNYIDVPVVQATVKNCWPDGEDSVSMILTKLKPETQYSVLIKAATEAGLGNSTLPLTFVTREASAISFYPDIEQELTTTEEQEDLQYKQKLGIALGVSISLLCILLCVSCIVFRRKCLKREALVRGRLAATNNYYPSSTTAPYSGTSLQLRLPEPCIAEAHEMQHLVGEDRTTHIPPITPSHLDTKGGMTFPNGQLSGSLKHVHANGQVANGHVHITENPRYDYNNCNGHLNPRRTSKQGRCSIGSAKGKESPNTVEETDKDVNEPHENGKIITEVGKISDYNSNCNRGLDEINKLRYSSSGYDLFDESSGDNGLNVTQLTCLDDSFSSLKKVPPLLGPNG